jgi:hypothetical protein
MIITLLICVVVGAVAYCFVPQKYDIYLNNELVNYACAYMYYGHLYLPVIGTMKVYGYEVIDSDTETPEFVIDGVKYELSIEENQITDEKDTYLGYSTGKRFLNISGNDCYALVNEIDYFFNEIGKEKIEIVSVNHWKRHVYIEVSVW